MTMRKQSHIVRKRSHGAFPIASASIRELSSTIDLFKIAIEMKEIGLPEHFIIDAVRKALDYEGISDLMMLWKNETAKKERAEIIADIQDMLDDCNQNGKMEEVFIKFNDLENIAKNIRSFKDSLLQIVNEHGGICYLAELTGIPQPSLSRFFNSNAMPHRSTLLKIGKALKLEEIKMDLLWTK